MNHPALWFDLLRKQRRGVDAFPLRGNSTSGKRRFWITSPSIATYAVRIIIVAPETLTAYPTAWPLVQLAPHQLQLLHPAVAIEKLLHHPEWSLVQFLRTLQQLELPTKFPVQ